MPLFKEGFKNQVEFDQKLNRRKIDKNLKNLNQHELAGLNCRSLIYFTYFLSREKPMNKAELMKSKNKINVI